MESAALFRVKENLEKLNNDSPGYYKWWANKEQFFFLINKLDIDFSDIKDSIETKEDKYCIYIGIAVKESVKSRINWHINQHHTQSAVRSGTLSTLRQTISSIISNNQYDEIGTNEFIDKLFLEYFELPYEIKSIQANTEIHKIERDAMSKNLYILNLQENKHIKAKPIIKKIKQLRKKAK